MWRFRETERRGSWRRTGHFFSPTSFPPLPCAVFFKQTAQGDVCDLWRIEGEDIEVEKVERGKGGGGTGGTPAGLPIVAKKNYGQRQKPVAVARRNSLLFFPWRVSVCLKVSFI